MSDQRQLIQDQTITKIAALEQDNAILREAIAEAGRRSAYIEQQLAECQERLKQMECGHGSVGV